MASQSNKAMIPTATITFYFPKPIKPSVHKTTKDIISIIVKPAINNSNLTKKKKSDIILSKIKQNELFQQAGIQQPQKRTSIDKYN